MLPKLCVIFAHPPIWYSQQPHAPMYEDDQAKWSRFNYGQTPTESYGSTTMGYPGQRYPAANGYQTQESAYGSQQSYPVYNMRYNPYGQPEEVDQTSGMKRGKNRGTDNDYMEQVYFSQRWLS